MSNSFDLMVAGRPSLDVIFSGLPEWPALGRDIESGQLGVCAGTSFNTPAAANRIGMRVAYVATLGNDPWSRLIRDEFGAEGLSTDFLEMQDRPLPAISVALNFDSERGFVTHWGSGDAYDADLAVIRDTTGAGDCFNAGFLAGWLVGLRLEESLALGVICGSRAIGDIGGYRGCTREAELRAIAAARGITLPRRETSPQGEPI